jgi:methionine-rich copper-binding protein CopC
MRHALLRIAAGFAGVAIASATFTMAAGPASAHTKLQSSTPKSDARLDEPPTELKLVFNDPVRGKYTQVKMLGPDGNNYESGTPRTEGGTVTQRVRPLGPAGKYRIGYRVVAPDGHPLTGELDFILTKAGPGAAAASAPSGAGSAAASRPAAENGAPTDSESEFPTALLVGGGIGAVLLAGAVLALRRRDTESEPTDDQTG